MGGFASWSRFLAGGAWCDDGWDQDPWMAVVLRSRSQKTLVSVEREEQKAHQAMGLSQRQVALQAYKRILDWPESPREEF